MNFLRFLKRLAGAELSAEKRILEKLKQQNKYDTARLWEESTLADLQKLDMLLLVLLSILRRESAYLKEKKLLDDPALEALLKDLSGLVGDKRSLLQKIQSAQIKEIERLGPEEWFIEFTDEIGHLDNTLRQILKASDKKRPYYVAATKRSLFPKVLLQRHTKFGVFYSQLVKSLSSKKIPLEKVECSRMGKNDYKHGYPRIDPINFEVYKLRIYAGSVLPIMEIEAAVADKLDYGENIHPSQFTVGQWNAPLVCSFYNGYFGVKGNAVPLGKHLDTLAVMVDSDMGHSGIARQLVDSLNKGTRIYAVQYNRSKIREAIEKAFLSQTIAKLESFNELHLRFRSKFPPCFPPSLMERLGYRAHFSQGAHGPYHQWLIDFDINGKITKSVILIGSSPAEREFRSYWVHQIIRHYIPPEKYKEIYGRFRDELKKVIAQYGKICGHEYSLADMEKIMPPNYESWLAAGGKPTDYKSVHNAVVKVFP